MSLPSTIPAGVRVVVRTKAGIDPSDGRMKYSDYLGHVLSWNGTTLELKRDASLDGSRGVENMSIPAEIILIIKPVPERKAFPGQPEPSS